METLRTWALSSFAVVVSLSQVELVFKILVLVATLVYTIFMAINQFNKIMDNRNNKPKRKRRYKKRK